MIRALVADDQALVRGGFRAILDTHDDIEVIAEAADGAEAVTMAVELRPEVALLDVRMPNVDGIEATRRIVAATDTVRVLILTTFDLDEYVYGAMKAGASGFLLKTVPPAQLVAAVRATVAGDALLAPEVTRRLIERYLHEPRPSDPSFAALQTLTPRELEVFHLLGRGQSNAEIAGTLIVSDATAKTHVARVLTKLGLRDRAQAVVLAYESGLRRPGQRDDPSPSDNLSDPAP